MPRFLNFTLLVALLPLAALAQQSTPPAPTARPPAAQQQTQPPVLKNVPQNPATPAQPGDDTSYVIKVGVNEVNLVFTVTDNSGRFVRNLQQQDFQLLDDRMPPAKVLRFTQQTDLPLRVGLLIDTSSSVHSRFDFEQRSAIDFLQQVLRRGKDEAFVMGFDSQADITQPFTANLDKLASGINGMKSNGGTALYDAIYKACRDQMLPVHANQSLRKTIVLLSDGHDNQSHFPTSLEAVRECQRAETSVYTISTNVSPTKDSGDDVLAHISEETGGRTFVPRKEEDVAHAFYLISDELRSQYALEYRPANFKTDGGFRPIWLATADHKYHVSTRKGYYAPRE
jgi:VWFA-related protein